MPRLLVTWANLALSKMLPFAFGSIFQMLLYILFLVVIRGPIRSDRERELDAWKRSVDAQLQEICRELKRTPRHSDVGSSFPT